MSRITPQMIEDLVDSYEFISAACAPTLTVCVLRLTNGTVVTGESNVIDPVNYDKQLGQEVALKAAKEKIWQLEGYAMKRELAD